MLLLQFAGWFQCRLATDPDPAEEPRGVSGFTFALPGEPDFDRVIRFHDPVAPRSYAPEVGVFVETVCLDGETLPEHPLRGARVELLDEPKFESRNYVLRDASQGPIVPFHLRITGNGINIQREDVLFPSEPHLPLHQLPQSALARRGSWIPLTIDPVRIAEATGILDHAAHRAKRRVRLEQDLLEASDPATRAALDKRIFELGITAPEKLQVLAHTLYNDFRFDINGPAEVSGTGSQIGAVPDASQDWPIAFWMGGWDSDALSGYVRGMLTIPGDQTRGKESGQQEDEHL